MVVDGEQDFALFDPCGKAKVEAEGGERHLRVGPLLKEDAEADRVGERQHRADVALVGARHERLSGLLALVAPRFDVAVGVGSRETLAALMQPDVVGFVDDAEDRALDLFVVELLAGQLARAPVVQADVEAGAGVGRGGRAGVEGHQRDAGSRRFGDGWGEVVGRGEGRRDRYGAVGHALADRVGLFCDIGERLRAQIETERGRGRHGGVGRQTPEDIGTTVADDAEQVILAGQQWIDHLEPVVDPGPGQLGVVEQDVVTGEDRGLGHLVRGAHDL